MRLAIKEDVLVGIVCALKGQRYDTCDIARKVGCKESQVYNLLARMKEREAA